MVYGYLCSKTWAYNSNYLGPNSCYCIPLKNSDDCNTLADHTKT
ncbi:hypothetical protein E2986_11790 [Frieseomelitta varia]|uniref:Uncharacterized protein n=1 Tax=Frieseomelitta varia TaxID=561572 RepID=A0A833VVX4_9HYME|nr:hypothetical protein E2986_11790 [Frieseomelitta varia]